MKYKHKIHKKMFMMPIIRPPDFPLNPLQDLKRMTREGKKNRR